MINHNKADFWQRNASGVIADILDTPVKQELVFTETVQFRGNMSVVNHHVWAGYTYCRIHDQQELHSLLSTFSISRLKDGHGW